MTTTIETKLDTLAEYQSQKDSIDAAKKALLNDVSVPAEVQDKVSASNLIIASIDAAASKDIAAIQAEVNSRLDKIVIPDQIREAYEQIEQQRALVRKYQDAKIADIRERANNLRGDASTNLQAQVKSTYDALAQRKRDIEAEFAGKLNDVDDNIKALEAEIKAATKAAGKTVKGKFISAIYVRGRISWDNDGLNAYADQNPGVVKYRTIGEPSITLRRV